MIRSIRNIHSIFRKDEGASAVEYGLLVAGIAALVALAVFTLGGTVNSVFEDTEECVDTSGTTCP